MACHKGLFCITEHVPDSCIIQMRNIDNHTQTFHFLNEFNSLFRQTMLCIRQKAGISLSLMQLHPVGISQLILKIPGQSHHSCAQAVKITQQRSFPQAHTAFLQRQHGGHSAFCYIFFQIAPGFYNTNLILVRLQLRVERINQLHSVFKRIRMGFQMNKQTEILQQIISFFHFLQINMKRVLQNRHIPSILMIL